MTIFRGNVYSHTYPLTSQKQNGLIVLESTSVILLFKINMTPLYIEIIFH